MLLAAQPELITPVLQGVQRVITCHLLTDVGLRAGEGQGGAVTLIQRFGSAANLNIHLHCLVLDGVYRCGAEGAPAFVEAGTPTDDQLHALLQTVVTRLMKMLTHRGVLIEEMGQTCLADLDGDGEQARTLRPLQAASITYRIAFGPRAGQKVLTLRGAMPRENRVRQPLCADIDGFSLHAAVRIQAHDRRRLEQLCRYITRLALSDERVQFDAECEVEPVRAASHRLSWARLLKRVFDIDMQPCPNCGAGELKIIAAILQRPVIEKILTHLGLDPQPPIWAWPRTCCRPNTKRWRAARSSARAARSPAPSIPRSFQPRLACGLLPGDGV